MEREQALDYFKTMGTQLRALPERTQRTKFLYRQMRSADFSSSFEILRNEAGQRALLLAEAATVQTPHSTDSVLATEPTLNLERPLTRREQTMLWAQDVASEYQALPQHNSAARKKAKRFLDQVGDRLLHNPEDIEPASTQWQKGTDSTDSTPFYSCFEQFLGKKAKEEWDKLTPDDLTGLVKALAHSHNSRSMIQNILTNYFKGPEGRNQCVDAAYNFAYGALDLVDDPVALAQVAKILSYQTEIYPLDSRTVQTLLLTRSLAVDDDRLLARASNTDIVALELARLAGEDVEAIKSRVGSIAKDPRVKGMFEKESLRLAKRLGYVEFSRRFQLITLMGSIPFMASESEEAYDQTVSRWPFNVVHSLQDPLRKKLVETIFDKSNSQIMMQEVSKGEYTDKGRPAPVLVSIRRPEGYIQEILMPAELVGDRTAITKLALATRPPEDMLRELDATRRTGRTILWPKFIDFKGEAIRTIFRRASGYEDRQHPVSGLETIGFPTPNIPEGLSAAEAIEDLVAQIRQERFRYLNLRGVTKPVQSGMLRQLGYRHFDFQKDPNQPDQTIAKIFVQGLPPYQVLLDRFFSLNLEGRSLNSPSFAADLQYTLVWYLNRFFCDERVHLEGMSLEESQRVVRARIGHHRFLPEGQTKSVDAIRYCREYEGEDLEEIDRERRAWCVNTNRPVRNTTYVRPVIREIDETQMDPLVIRMADPFIN